MFKVNNEGELPIEVSLNRISAQIAKETAAVEQPPILIIKEAAPIKSSPPKKQTVNPSPEPVYQTPPTTKSTPESIGWFYERFFVRASRPSSETPLSCSEPPFFMDIPTVPQEQKNFFARFRKRG